jgi:hypothetical protein
LLDALFSGAFDRHVISLIKAAKVPEPYYQLFR